MATGEQLNGPCGTVWIPGWGSTDVSQTKNSSHFGLLPILYSVFITVSLISSLSLKMYFWVRFLGHMPGFRARLCPK